MQFLASNIWFICIINWILPVFSCPTGCVCNSDSVRCVSNDAKKLQHLPAPPAIPENTRILFVEYQNITRIRKDDLRNLVNLESLRVWSSNVQEIDDGAFQYQSKLESLYLDNNNISRVNGPTFRGLGMLGLLNLFNNPNMVMDPCSLSWLGSLERLFLFNTSVVFNLGLWQDCNNQFVPSVVSGIMSLSIGGEGGFIDSEDLWKLPDLTTLSLLHPPTSLSTGYNLSSLQSLSSLTLAGLTIFPREFLIHGSFSTVHISDSSFTHLPAFAFSNIPVTTCNIVHSALVYIHKDAFRRMSRLITLNLNNNELRTLPEGVFIDLSLPLQKLSLNGNPWRCNCSVHWLFGIVSEEVASYDSRRDGICDSPVEWAGVPLKEVDSSSVAPCDPLDAPLESTRETHQTTVFPSVDSSPCCPDDRTRETEENSPLLMNWTYLALALAAILIVLLAVSLVICWIRASKNKGRVKKEHALSIVGDGLGIQMREGVRSGGQSNVIAHPAGLDNSSADYYSTVRDPAGGYGNRVVVQKMRNTRDGTERVWRSDDAGASSDARDIAGNTVEYERQILNVDNDAHVYDLAPKLFH